ncbi:AAA family ATPase [Asticcacaulis sp. DW145]|uniref:tyrosine-protein kinase family protein n=1 Tax=Asticcacaulis sp. DW145 TaxID=3095608 RepID=UPI00308EF98E|nr:AAA family ATPase [Asticcacaulis sp. DW145]
MSSGKIITFYSYKGGVGRTMAVANVAFLAAMHGAKVLVMDWDLEAPGLPYYFKAFLESTEARTIRNRPGILDLLWRWAQSIDIAKTPRALEDAIKTFSSREYFSSYVIPIGLESDNGGKLDLITAGAVDLADRHPAAYGDVLANFAWPTFFTEQAGGKLLQSLREWAKSEYDFVFIDSRTGMADVAGICTMQLPDTVALCFVLNRQNIEGISGVAGTIRSQAGDDVELFAVPMRVSASGTSEEADAIARGIHEITKAGGLTKEAAVDDFKFNAVRAAPNVPYYEAVVPTLATDPGTDPLLLNYLRLGNRLLRVSMDVPEMDPDWISVIRRRLQPRLATSEYVLNLRSSDPVRATEELGTLIESAADTVLDGGDITEEYVVALVETALVLTKAHESPFEIIGLLRSTLDLLRVVHAEQPEIWRTFLIQVLERYLDISAFFFEEEDELALIEEFDNLLAASTKAVDVFKRAKIRRKAAQIYISLRDHDAANQSIADLVKLLRDLQKHKIENTMMDDLRVMEVETSLLKGDYFDRSGDSLTAFNEYQGGLAKMERLDISEHTLASASLKRVGFDLHSRLVRNLHARGDLMNATKHAVSAAKYSDGQPQMASQFVEFAKIILSSKDVSATVEFCNALFNETNRRLISTLPNYYGRSSRSTIEFINSISGMIDYLLASDHPNLTQISYMVEAVTGLGRILSRRSSMHSLQREAVKESVDHLSLMLSNIQFDPKAIQHLDDSFSFDLHQRRARDIK